MRGWLPFLLLFTLAACNLSEATPVAVVQPTAAYLSIAQVSTTTPEPSPTRLIQAVPTATNADPTQTAAPTESPYACGVDLSQTAHIQHRVAATLDYAAKSVDVAQEIIYTNRTEVAFSDLVLAVEANSWDGAFDLKQITRAGNTTTFALNANELTIPLPAPLNPGCAVTIQLVYSIDVPQMGIGLSSFKGYFGYSERQMNLALWLATPAARLNNTWLVHEPQPIGEQTVLEQADWEVTFNVENAPDTLQIAAPGTSEQLDDNRWRYVHTDARDFALSLGESYRTISRTTQDGTQIEVTHFGDVVRTLPDGSTVNGATHTLEVAVQAVEQYSSLFGEYPYERLVIVQGDFPDGMEFSGFVFVSTNWFYSFEGGVQNYLTLITVHEISHQWWYARVGNDAAYAPWLDEALATYSEYIYYEEFHPDLKNWWWSFRVAWYNPQGDVDSNVYEYESARDYINAVYLRGVQMLHNLREDIGTQEFFDLLADYAQAGDGAVATPDLFWSLFTPEQLAATSGTRTNFLRDPDVLPDDIPNP